MNRESTPRTNRPSTDSRSASSHDSRAYSRQLRTRHQRSRSPYHRSSPNRFTGEIEVKDEQLITCKGLTTGNASSSSSRPKSVGSKDG
ncbi:hypothetical protein TNCV_747421 [Trichonephila clavipes]|nr:hypothetical protein TNCV_747421 [Trichonephila clavipes]